MDVLVYPKLYKPLIFDVHCPTGMIGVQRIRNPVPVPEDRACCALVSGTREQRRPACGDLAGIILSKLRVRKQSFRPVVHVCEVLKTTMQQLECSRRHGVVHLLGRKLTEVSSDSRPVSAAEIVKALGGQTIKQASLIGCHGATVSRTGWSNICKQ